MERCSSARCSKKSPKVTLKDPAKQPTPPFTLQGLKCAGSSTNVRRIGKIIWNYLPVGAMRKCSKSKTDMHAAVLYLQCQDIHRPCGSICEGLNSQMPLQRKIISPSMTRFNQSRELRVSSIGFISCRGAELMQQLSRVSCSTLDPYHPGQSA